MKDIINVGMAEMAVTCDSNVLITSTIGSCVVVSLYAPTLKAGGIAHIMLPESKMAKKPFNPAKFADTAIEAMFNEIVKLGAKPNQIEAKIVGGANMFSFSVCYPFFNVGEKNILVAKRTLHKKKIKLIAQDIGGDYGRRVEFDCSSGKLRVKSIKKGEKEI